MYKRQLREPRDSGTQGADAAHQHVDVDPRLRGPVERVDDLLIDDGVDLHPDVGRLARGGPRDLLLDLVDQARANGTGRDQQTLELAPRGPPGELVEEPGEIFPDVRVAGEQAVVLVEARRLRVIVAGADVAIAAQPVGLLPDDEGELAVRLEAHDAVDLSLIHI